VCVGVHKSPPQVGDAAVSVTIARSWDTWLREGCALDDRK